jgi:hypothetical protein
VYGLIGSTIPLRLSLRCSTKTLRFSTRTLGWRLLASLRLQPWAAPQRPAQGFRICAPCRRVDRFALVSSLLRPARPGPSSGITVPRLLRSSVPLAASPLEFGQPGISTPGIFRPWPFSSLRRFTPPDGSPVLFHTSTTYGIQRTVAMFCLLCSPFKSIQRTVLSGTQKPDMLATSDETNQ